jgi:hypothetical protein
MNDLDAFLFGVAILIVAGFALRILLDILIL